MSENRDRPTYGQEYGGGHEYGGGSTGAQGAGQDGQEYRAGSEYGRNPYGENPYGRLQEPNGEARPQQWQQPGQQWGSGQQWPGGPMQEPRRPTSLTAAFWLIIAAAVVMVGSTLMGAFAMTTPQGRALIEDAAQQQIEASGVTGAEAQQMMDMTISMLPGVMIALALVALALYLLVAFTIRSGSRAARVVGTVLAALSVLLLLVSVLSGAVGLEVVWVLLGVAGIVMAYRPDATEYMRQRAWAKTMRTR